MAKKTTKTACRSIEEVAEIVEAEGLGYSVLNYMGHGEIDDPVLAAAWKRAHDALEEIESILEPYLP